MYEILLDLIKQQVKITDNDITLCKEYFEPVLFPKNRIIEEEGKIPHYLYFVVNGYMRLFSFNDNGDEITSHINCKKKIALTFFRFGVCPMCVTMSITYKIGQLLGLRK